MSELVACDVGTQGLFRRSYIEVVVDVDAALETPSPCSPIEIACSREDELDTAVVVSIEPDIPVSTKEVKIVPDATCIVAGVPIPGFRVE